MAKVSRRQLGGASACVVGSALEGLALATHAALGRCAGSTQRVGSSGKRFLGSPLVQLLVLLSPFLTCVLLLVHLFQIDGGKAAAKSHH